MHMKRREKKGIDDIIKQIKEIQSYPSDVCFLTYCILGNRLYYRIEGPKDNDHPRVSYYFAAGDRETKRPDLGQGWIGFPLETYIKNLREYIERRGLKAHLKKVKYDPGIETKKKLGDEEIESIFNMAIEMANNNQNNHK